MKKGKTLLKDGVEPFTEGKWNFENPKFCIEQKARERMQICSQCPYFQLEPIDFLRVEDQNIPVLSGMSCMQCGCISSYKLRQNIEICEQWQK